MAFYDTNTSRYADMWPILGAAWAFLGLDIPACCRPKIDPRAATERSQNHPAHALQNGSLDPSKMLPKHPPKNDQ